jgi:hypothetical protein
MLQFNVLRSGASVGLDRSARVLPHYRATRLHQRRGLLPRYVARRILQSYGGRVLAGYNDIVPRARADQSQEWERKEVGGSAYPARLQLRAGLNVSSTRSTIGSKMCR